MNIANLFSKFNPQEKEEPKTFLAVEISVETVKSALWTVEEKKTKVLKIGSLQEWDGSSRELLLAAVDGSVSLACEKQEGEPEGIIFSLPRAWIKENTIVPDKKELLKFICEKLELKPLGFVVTLEVLVAQLKNEEGTPVNAILVQLQEAQSLISLVQFGKILGTKAVSRSNDLAADVQEGLARFEKIENFPSRMIIFDGTLDLEEYKQQLVSFNWQEKLSFLHFPKVEALESSKTIKACAIAGGSEVAKALKFEIRKPGIVEPKVVEQKAAEQKAAADLGFLEDKDVGQLESQPEAAEKPPAIAQAEVVSAPGQIEETVAIKPARKGGGFPQRLWLNLRLILSGGKKRLFKILILLLFLLLPGGAWAFCRFVPKATVTIFFTPKTQEKELEIVLDPAAKSLDLGSKTIPAIKKEVTIEGEETAVPSGEKIIGDKAKGEVLIYNKTDLSKTFLAGEVLVGPDNLKFTLDEEVVVASRSAAPAEEGEQIVWGKSTSSVTASAIGPEANLAGGSTFTFKDYADKLYSAKTENGLQGGTSRQVKIVSSDDLSRLLAKLSNDLKDKAISQLKNEISADEEIISEEMGQEILTKNFSAQKGDEADQLTLKLKIKFTCFVYKKSDRDSLLTEALKTESLADFIFNPSETKVETEKVTPDQGKTTLTVKISAYLLPKINFEELKKNLAGRRLEETNDYLNRLPNFSRADIAITPSLIKRLPKLQQNIIIETEAEK